jgi:hypothetical protein
MSERPQADGVVDPSSSTEAYSALKQATPRKHRFGFFVPRLADDGNERLTLFQLDFEFRTTDTKEHVLAALTHVIHDLTEFIKSDPPSFVPAYPGESPQETPAIISADLGKLQNSE